MNSSITCLVPFFNEKDRILATLKQLTKINNLQEIICVNDGSTDHGEEDIRKNFPQVKLISLTQNMGKAAAIFEGVSKIKTEYVIMFDADLYEIKPNEIETAIQKIQSDPAIDMIILRRVVESKILTLIRHDIVMSGQRILRTEDLKKVGELKPNKYQIEMAINDYMAKNNKNCYWMPLTTKNTKKFHKYGLKIAARLYYDAFKGFFTYSGILGYLKQIMFFCRNRAIEFSN